MLSVFAWPAGVLPLQGVLDQGSRDAGPHSTHCRIWRCHQKICLSCCWHNLSGKGRIQIMDFWTTDTHKKSTCMCPFFRSLVTQLIRPLFGSLVTQPPISISCCTFNKWETFMLTLESWRFPVLGEVSCFVRTLPNCLRNRARSYYIIVLLSSVNILPG